MMTDEQFAYYVLKLITQKIFHNQDTLLLPISCGFFNYSPEPEALSIDGIQHDLASKKPEVQKDAKELRKNFPKESRIITVDV